MTLREAVIDGRCYFGGREFGAWPMPAFHPASYSNAATIAACDMAPPIAFIALHTRAAYVSKAAI